MGLTEIRNLENLEFLNLINSGFSPNNKDEWDAVKYNENCIAYQFSGNSRHTFAHGVYDFCKNTVLFLRQGDPYHVKIIEPGRKCIAIHFQTDGNLLPKSELFVPDNPALFRSLFLESEKHYFNKKPEGQLYCKGLLYLIFAHITSQGDESNKKLPGLQREAIRKATRYIHQNFSHSLNIEKLAWEAGMSVQYFRRLFRIYHECSPVEYIRNFRIERAKDLLKVSYYTIGDIAEKLGFPDLYYFSRVFKQVTGETPSDFRKNL
jgi:AraC-like DNA-binding protein